MIPAETLARNSPTAGSFPVGASPGKAGSRMVTSTGLASLPRNGRFANDIGIHRCGVAPSAEGGKPDDKNRYSSSARTS